MNLSNNEIGKAIDDPFKIKIGDMPDGKMAWSLNDKIKLSGFDCETIVIEYKFRSGVTPNGIFYNATQRMAFLPNNDEGLNILKMFIVAFIKRLTFTIGTSLTSK